MLLLKQSLILKIPGNDFKGTAHLIEHAILTDSAYLLASKRASAHFLEMIMDWYSCCSKITCSDAENRHNNL